MKQEPDEGTAPDSSRSPSPAQTPEADAPAAADAPAVADTPATSTAATAATSLVTPKKPGNPDATENQADSETSAEPDSAWTPIEPPASAKVGSDSPVTSADPAEQIEPAGAATSTAATAATSLVTSKKPKTSADLEAPDARDARPGIPTLVLLIVLAIIAMAASAELVLSEIQTLKQPAAHLGCDLNPLIGCSASLTTWQAHLLFGIPNALVGVGLFAGLAGVFLAWCGGWVSRWLALLIEAGLTAGMVLIVFFLHQSIFEFTKLCPFCFIVWTCTIVLWVQLGAALMRLGWLLPDTGFARIWTAQRWLITAIILLLIVLVVAVTLSDKLVYLF